ncbi:hypothetical protein EJ105_27555, partial [Xanthobacter aminoxidans]|uniref:hypothetical protein n=1 Tax=Xanthobacter aminoxidans TaxID=186280 RepID=UPI002023163A
MPKLWLHNAFAIGANVPLADILWRFVALEAPTMGFRSVRILNLGEIFASGLKPFFGNIGAEYDTSQNRENEIGLFSPRFVDAPTIPNQIVYFRAIVSILKFANV